MSNYLKAFGHAPGDYHCQCVACKGNFFGDKRATVCKSCAENSAWKPQPDTPARCDELKTIGYVHPTFVTELEYGHDEIFRTVRIPESWEPVITRQNAEEVIAAKDARIAELEADNKRLREALEAVARFEETPYLISVHARAALGEVKP